MKPWPSAASECSSCSLVSLWGCGYRPLGAAPPDPQVRPTLAIPLFANRSTEVGLEAIFATALINAFAQTRAVKVVPGDREADLVLEGKVRSVDNTSVAFDAVTHSTVRRVTLRVELTLRRNRRATRSSGRTPRSSRKITW